jgi:phenylalanyl-tRNA synthetase beta chain
LEEQQFVKLLNPLSNEMDVMRSSLLFGGLASISYNTNRQLKDLAFFEVGKIYTKYEDKYKEESQIGIWLTGQKAQHSWTDKAGDVNYYTMRGIVEALLSRYVKTSLALTFPTEDTMLYDVFKIQMGNDTLVTGGLVKPHVLSQFDLDKPVCYASVSVKVFMEAVKRTKFKYKEVSKFPIIKRDLSLLMDHSVGFDSIKNTVLQTDKQLIKDVTVFDVYVGKNLPEGKKSYAISLTITDENKTMRDEEVEKLMDKVIKNLGEKAGAVLR